jgi:hypothetical protein
MCFTGQKNVKQRRQPHIEGGVHFVNRDGCGAGVLTFRTVEVPNVNATRTTGARLTLRTVASLPSAVDVFP